MKIKLLSCGFFLSGVLFLLSQDRSPALSVCRHPTRGSCRSIDPDKLSALYLRFSSGMKFKAPSSVTLDIPPPSASLPYCKFPSSEKFSLEHPLPKTLVGSSLYFVAPSDLSALKIPPRSFLFLLDARPEDLYKHRAFPASRELLKVLGVRCRPARVFVRSVDHVEIQTDLR